MNKPPSVLLASQSPRRKKILQFIGLPCRSVKPVGVIERVRPGETPRSLVRRLALEKAMVVSKKYPNYLVIGADTVVVYRGRIFGKPKNRLAAKKMLLQLSGRTHEVWTGVALVGHNGKNQRTHIEITKVCFKDIPIHELETYLMSNEPYDKAGAYAIQGTARKWIHKWEGDYFNVMGLPIQWIIEELNTDRQKLRLV